MSETPENRRPLKTRSKAWAGALASALGAARISPDRISLFSVVFAVLGAALLLTAGLETQPVLRGLMLVMAAVMVQLRLLANMLDGMVAVEHGLGSSSGAIWNELPDRIADALFLVAAGYAAWGMGLTAGSWLGWLAALLAVLTAYVRELGRGLDFPADFSGPDGQAAPDVRLDGHLRAQRGRAAVGRRWAGADDRPGRDRGRDGVDRGAADGDAGAAVGRAGSDFAIATLLPLREKVSGGA
jgi:phosphatidylglycerophosphate synthase